MTRRIANLGFGIRATIHHEGAKDAILCAARAASRSGYAHRPARQADPPNTFARRALPLASSAFIWFLRASVSLWFVLNFRELRQLRVFVMKSQTGFATAQPEKR
jgi:hypothetical protein